MVVVAVVVCVAAYVAGRRAGAGATARGGRSGDAVAMGDVVDDGAFIVLRNHVLRGRIEGRRGHR